MQSIFIQPIFSNDGQRLLEEIQFSYELEITNNELPTTAASYYYRFHPGEAKDGMLLDLFEMKDLYGRNP